MIKSTDVTPELVLALATLRLEARKTSNGRNVQQAMNVLDNARVFSVIDEATDYAAPMDVVQEAAEAAIPDTIDPADTPKTESIAVVMEVKDDEDLTLSGRIVNVLRDAREIYNTPGKECSEGWWDGAVDYILTGEGRDGTTSAHMVRHQGFDPAAYKARHENRTP